MAQKRFKIGEIVRYRPLECMGTVVAKEHKNGVIWYEIKLTENIEDKRIAYTDGVCVEHLWE